MSKFHPASPDFQRNIRMGGVVVFDPLTIAIASAAVGAVSSISAGNTAARNYNAQAAANDYNATIQRNNAARVSMEYSVREDQQRREQSIIIGRQRAGITEANIGVTQTAIDLEDQSNINAELDNLTTRYEGSTQRAALLQDADMLNFEAGVNRSNAKAAKTAGYIGALGNVLGAAGRYRNTPTTPYGPGSSTLPWQSPGNVKPQWAGGGYY